MFDPLHYLALIEQKINALDQAAPLAGWQLPEQFATLRRLLEVRMGKQGKREYVQVLRLLEPFKIEDVTAAVRDDAPAAVVYFSCRPPPGPESPSTAIRAPTNNNDWQPCPATATPGPLIFLPTDLPACDTVAVSVGPEIADAASVAISRRRRPTSDVQAAVVDTPFRPEAGLPTVRKMTCYRTVATKHHR